MYLPVFQRVHVPAEGSEIWVAAENAYNERVARVENQIIARLRDRLGTARNANEMFLTAICRHGQKLGTCIKNG